MEYNKFSIDKFGHLLIDNEYINSIFAKIYSSNNFFKWLVPSFNLQNISELCYIEELVKRKISCNFPLLICDSDLDFSCTVVVVKIKYTENTVIFKKFGTLKKDDDFWGNYRYAGIRKIENWSDYDWKNYSSIAYDLLYDNYFFNEWCAENWNEEVYRRTWGYYHEYMNNDSNTEWIGELNFKFDLNEHQDFFINQINVSGRAL